MGQPATGSDLTFLARLEHEGHPDEIRLHADKVLTTHLAAGRVVIRAWRALPESGRYCEADGERWPCKSVQWARSRKVSTLSTWSL